MFMFYIVLVFLLLGLLTCHMIKRHSVVWRHFLIEMDVYFLVVMVCSYYIHLFVIPFFRKGIWDFLTQLLDIDCPCIRFSKMVIRVSYIVLGGVSGYISKMRRGNVHLWGLKFLLIFLALIFLAGLLNLLYVYFWKFCISYMMVHHSCERFLEL